MNLKQATQLIKKTNHSCIILKNNEIIYTSSDSGVKPLLLFLKEKLVVGENDSLILIDKIIGKAALLLAAKCKIQEIYTFVVSTLALEAANHHNIQCTSLETVSYIINREGNGMCPMESSVIDTLDIDQAYHNIIATMDALMKI